MLPTDFKNLNCFSLSMDKFKHLRSTVLTPTKSSTLSITTEHPSVYSEQKKVDIGKNLNITPSSPKHFLLVFFNNRRIIM